MENKNIYDFIKTNIDKAGIKTALGYGLSGLYFKVKFLDTKLFNLAIGMTQKDDVAAILGINIKKKVMSFDIGVMIELQKLIDEKQIKPRLFAGFSFNF